jgi:hypothetical protein
MMRMSLSPESDKDLITGVSKRKKLMTQEKAMGWNGPSGQLRCASDLFARIKVRRTRQRSNVPKRRQYRLLSTVSRQCN